MTFKHVAVFAVVFVMGIITTPAFAIPTMTVTGWSYGYDQEQGQKPGGPTIEVNSGQVTVIAQDLFGLGTGMSYLEAFCITPYLYTYLSQIYNIAQPVNSVEAVYGPELAKVLGYLMDKHPITNHQESVAMQNVLWMFFDDFTTVSLDPQIAPLTTTWYQDALANAHLYKGGTSDLFVYQLVGGQAMITTPPAQINAPGLLPPVKELFLRLTKKSDKK